MADTRAQMDLLTALNTPEELTVAIVEVENTGAKAPAYVRKRFENGSDFSVTSVNCDLRDLVEQGEEPR